MARMMLTEDGVRPLTQGDRGVIDRSTDLDQLVQLLTQILALLKAKRPPVVGLTLIALLLLCGASFATLFTGHDMLALWCSLAALIMYLIHARFARKARGRFLILKQWLEALMARIAIVKELPVAAQEDTPAHIAEYELVGIPAPVFIGGEVRVMTEEDRLVIRAYQDLDALTALQGHLQSASRKVGAEEWLTRVEARIAQLHSRG